MTLLFRVLQPRERVIALCAMVVAVIAAGFWFWSLYRHFTKEVPDTGGTYTEGMLGQPLYLNPLFSQSSGPDGDMSRLMYDSLFTRDEQGQLMKEMVDDYTLSPDGMTYTMHLHQGIHFHDGQELTADDVVYTFQTIQDPAYKSPLRFNWQGVGVSSPDRYTVVFSLKKPYFAFLENLTTGILPKHIWESIPPENFSLAEVNLNPIGSGSFQVASPTDPYKKDSNGAILSYELKAFPDYFGKKPFLSRIVFRFYPTEDTLIDAYNRREISSLGGISGDAWEKVKDQKSARLYEVRQPRLFSVFFNEIKSVPLGYPEVRQALSLATDRDALVKDVLAGHGEVLSSPFMLGMVGFDQGSQISYDLGAAKKLLDDNGWVSGDDGIRSKKNQKLAFELVTPDWSDLVDTANILKQQWHDLGVDVSVRVVGGTDLQQTIIRPREYQALLYGEVSSFNPDPYSFWHSSQKSDPGTNFSMLSDSAIDDALATARETQDEGVRSEQFRIFQQRFKTLAPAVFVYSPHYLYIINQKIQGVSLENINTPSDRLASIAQWFIYTKRVGK
ncbi:MAG: ABC transporter substrate-binding protein [Candidatus Moraniibacteriota bacterium]